MHSQDLLQKQDTNIGMEDHQIAHRLRGPQEEAEGWQVRGGNSYQKKLSQGEELNARYSPACVRMAYLCSSLRACHMHEELRKNSLPTPQLSSQPEDPLLREP